MMPQTSPLRTCLIAAAALVLLSTAASALTLETKCNSNTTLIAFFSSNGRGEFRMDCLNGKGQIQKGVGDMGSLDVRVFVRRTDRSSSRQCKGGIGPSGRGEMRVSCSGSGWGQVKIKRD